MVSRTLKYQGKEYKTKVKYLTLKIAYEECEIFSPTKSHFMHNITEAINNYNARRLDWSTKYDLEEFNDFVESNAETLESVNQNNGKHLRR